MNEIGKTYINVVGVSQGLSAPASGQNSLAGGNVLPQKAAVSVESAAKTEGFQVTNERVQAAVEHMNNFIQANQRDLMFSYDPDAGETVVRVLDRTTQELIRQIPDETFLRISKSLSTDEPIRLINAQA